MLVSLAWLKELVDYQISAAELADALSLSSIGVKQQTEDYLELDLTYNRGDLLSLRGVAYEVAAITNSPLKFLSSASEDFIWVGQNLHKTPVEIADEVLSSVQCVARIENLKVGPSPKNWINKLNESGMRSVNNIADVTNLVMLEYGQPLHSFDARQVRDETIIVRTAGQDEGLMTLDGKLRQLSGEDIVLADTQGPLDVAGIMGGKASEVTDATSTILLSASIFNPIMVRKTSKRLGLYSEASKRFQHGLSKMRLLQALDAAIKMYSSLGGKLTAITLKGDFDQVKKSVPLSIKKTNALLGIKLDKQTISECLKRLNFAIAKSEGDILEVIPPYFRQDCTIPEDLMEEVARIYGYDMISSIPLANEKPIKIDQSFYEFLEKLKDACYEVGLTEVSTYSFYSTDVLANMAVDKDMLLKVSNPISSETQYLRFTIWENLLEVAARNIKKGFKDMAIFELAKTYHPKKAKLPEEGYDLSILMINGTGNPVTELHAILEKLMSKMGVKFSISESKGHPIEKKLFHPRRNNYIIVNNQWVGGLVEIHPRVVNRFGIEQRVAVVELSVNKLYG